MTRRTSSNPTVPRDPDDKRTQPRPTDPLKPRRTRKSVLEETDPDALSAPEFAKYNKKLTQNQRNGARRTRTAQRRQSPTRKLPPICGCPLDRKTKPGSAADRLTPREIKLYGIEDTYLSICTRFAGQNTMHQGQGYCDDCEERTRKKTDPPTGTTATGRTRRPRTADRSKGAMSQADLRRFHGEVMRSRDVLGLPVDIGPHEALTQEVQRTAGSIVYLEGLMKDLAETRDEGQQYQVLLQVSKLGLEPSALLQIIHWEREHLITASKAAIACGVAERRVRLAEEQGKMLVYILQAFIHDPALGLSPGQLMVAPQIMRKHLLALPSETSPEAYIDRVATATLPSASPEIIDVEEKP